MSNKKVVLIILDGWGIGPDGKENAVKNAKKDNWDKLIAKYPHSQLGASGLSVGLPDGVMGNSEVGHLNIGAGRIVYQDLVKINRACENGDLASNPVLREAFSSAKARGRSLHFIGLVSDAGVHAMDSHLYKLCDLAAENGLERVFIHALTDGRDSDPRSGAGYLSRLEDRLKRSTGILASVIGRYYAMDRDQRWERIKKAYDLFTSGTGRPVKDIIGAVRTVYGEGITDEFMEPLVRVDADGIPVGLIKPDDVVICFNFRTERLREITEALTQEDKPEFGLRVLPLHYYTLTSYNDDYKGIGVIFAKGKIQETLGELIARAGLKQLRLAETEKYAHVTFFFSGGNQDVFPGEERTLVPSPKIATYDLQPEMSAFKIRDEAVAALGKREFSFICMNFANPDMVGHTGVYPAIVKAVETVDVCLGEIIPAAQDNGYDVIILADHGNAEKAVNPDGTPNTAHSLNPVPCLLISPGHDKLADGILADVAPTVLRLMGLPQPPAMTGKSLI